MIVILDMVKIISRQEILSQFLTTSADECNKNAYTRIGETQVGDKMSLLRVLKEVLYGSYLRSFESEHYQIGNTNEEDDDGGENDSAIHAGGITPSLISPAPSHVQHSMAEKGSNLVDNDGAESQNEEVDKDGAPLKESVEEYSNIKANNKPRAKSSTNQRALKQLQIHTGYSDSTPLSALSGKRNRKAANFQLPVKVVDVPLLPVAIKKKVAAPKKQAVIAPKKRNTALIKVKVEKGASKNVTAVPAGTSLTRSLISAQQDEANAVYAKSANLLKQIEAATERSVQAALAISINTERLKKTYGM